MKTQGTLQLFHLMRYGAGILLLLVALTVPAYADSGVVEKSTKKAFDQVVTDLKREITGQKLVIVKEVPYQQMVKMVGVSARPMMGFEIFHPRYGKVIHQVNVSAFKDVPLRILVREEDNGMVTLEYRKPSVVFEPYSGLADLGKELDGVFMTIIERVIQ